MTFFISQNVLKDMEKKQSMIRMSIVEKEDEERCVENDVILRMLCPKTILRCDDILLCLDKYNKLIFRFIMTAISYKNIYF